MSAARLAAEAAFAAPTLQPTSAPVTQITVRKRRTASLEPAPAQAQALAAVDPHAEEALSAGPRTFRVEVVKEQGTEEAQGPAEADAADADARGWRSRRAHQQRPGPVTHTVLELPARPVEPSVQQLKAELAEVGPVLEGIQRAQDTVFIDRVADTAWQELSSRVDALSLEVQQQLTQQA